MPSPFGSVLIVGGCGFFGHHLVQEILERDGSQTIVSVIDIAVDKNRQPGASYFQADITDLDQLRKAVREIRPRVIFHTVSPVFYKVDKTLFDRVNISGTRNLIECAEDVGTVNAFVYTSSSSVIHNQRDPLVRATEDWPVFFQPAQPEYYSHTKAVGEDMVLKANRAKSTTMLTASIRPATMYGAGDTMLTTSLGKQALAGRARFHIGDGENLFDCTYVGNCAYAHVLTAQALLDASTTPPLPKDERVEGEAFFITNDEPLPFWGLQRIAAEVAGKPVKEEEGRSIPRWFMMVVGFLLEWVWRIFLFGEGQPSFNTFAVRAITMERTFCIDKAKDRLGYQPRVNTREGLEKALAWYIAVQNEGARRKNE